MIKEMDGIEGKFVRWKQHDEWEVLGKGWREKSYGTFCVISLSYMNV